MISGKPCVLVVDDDPVSLGFLTAALGQCGCRAVPAASAHAALAALADATIDLLLIDRRLPDGDGDELLRRLRARGVVAPAVATSADITPADRERLIEAGFVATLGKPASVDKWITEAAEKEFYKTRAEDSGFVFLTTLIISERSDGITLTSSHETKPQGFVATVKSLPMVFFKGVIKKAVLQDLNDIKAAVERDSGPIDVTVAPTATS